MSLNRFLTASQWFSEDHESESFLEAWGVMHDMNVLHSTESGTMVVVFLVLVISSNCGAASPSKKWLLKCYPPLFKQFTRLINPEKMNQKIDSKHINRLSIVNNSIT